mgnify:FL=1
MSEENLPEFIDLATSLLQKGEFEELITKFENLNISDPHIVYIHSLLGIAYYKKGFLIEAKKRFELSMDMDVKSLSKEIIIAVKKNYGLFLLENENYPEAQSIYKEIIKLEPDDLIAHLNSGEVFFHMAKLDDSIKELEIASNLDPENVETKTKLEKVNDFKNDIYGAQSTEDIINDELGEKIGSDLRVYRVLKGGMGVVYICLAVNYGYILVLKTYQDKFINSEEEKDKFIQEAYAWLKLEKHPNIVRGGTVLTIDDRLFIVLEYIPPDERDRNTLDDYLNSETLSKVQILDWAIQFCYGMEYAKSRGVAPHLDIKPQNIMITRDDKLLKITDFGLAKISDKEFKSLITENEKEYPGTDEWMAPEVFDGNAEVRSDIYSFGIVLYQMLNEGKHPFIVDNHSEWETAHKTHDVPYINTNLFPIIKKCLEKNPEKRYQSFKLLRFDLEEIYKSEIDNNIYTPSIEGLEIDGHFFKGYGFEALGFNDLAIFEYEKAKKTDSDNFLSNINLGSIFNRFQRPRDAINLYKKAVKLEPNSPMAYYNLGNAYNYDGQIGKAVQEYEKAIKLEPKFKECHINYGNLLRDIGKLDQAIEHFEAALENDPHFFIGLVNLGSALASKGLYDEAVQVFKDAEKISNNIYILYDYWGNCLISKEDYKGAFYKYLKAIALNPEYLNSQIGLGLSLIGLKKFDEGIQKFKEIIDNNPDNYEAFHCLGQAYANTENHTQAIPYFDECIRIEPESIDAYNQKGTLLALQRKHEEALECFDKALEINPNSDYALANKGNSLGKQGRHEEALEFFEKALEINPNNGHALNGITSALMNMAD